MAELKFNCPHCFQHIAGDESLRGLEISCPSCKKNFVVASAPDTPRPTPRRLTPARKSLPFAPVKWAAAALVCAVVGWMALKSPLKAKALQNHEGQNVILPDGLRSVLTVNPPGDSRFRRIEVKNPPGAVTMLLELKKSIPEYFADQKSFYWGFADIDFDTDNNAGTGANPLARQEENPLQGFEMRARINLWAKEPRVIAEWMNARMTLPNARTHIAHCQMETLGPRTTQTRISSGAPESRVKLVDKTLQFTVLYSELAVAPKQTIRIAVVDRSEIEGKIVNIFSIQLQ